MCDSPEKNDSRSNVFFGKWRDQVNVKRPDLLGPMMRMPEYQLT